MIFNIQDSIWDDKLKGLLIKWWEVEGYSASEISIEFGRLGYAVSKNAVIGKVYRMKLVSPQKKKRRLAERQRQRQSMSKRLPQFIVNGKKFNPRKPMEVKVSMIKPDGRKNVLLVDHKDGMCRAIVGYVNGQASKAVYCGQPVVCRTTYGSSKLVMLSYCAYHKARYLHDVRGNSERNQSVNGKLSVGSG